MKSRTTGSLFIISLLFLSLALLGDAAIPSDVRAQEESETTFIFPVKNAKVISTFEYDIYTYMSVAQQGVAKKLWIVAPICGVKAGDMITVDAGSFHPMVYNENLDITFENFVVAMKLEINGKAAEAFKAHNMPAGCVLRRSTAG